MLSKKPINFLVKVFCDVCSKWHLQLQLWLQKEGTRTERLPRDSEGPGRSREGAGPGGLGRALVLGLDQDSVSEL